MAPKAILTTGLLLVLTLPLGSGQGLGIDTVKLPTDAVDAANDSGCAIPHDAGASYETQEVIEEDEWAVGPRLNADGLLVPAASKSVTVAFQTGHGSRSPSAPTGDTTAEEEDTAESQEAGMTVEDCSAGVCAVEVIVYANTTTTVKMGVGAWAFLPFFFHIGGEASLEESVQARSESKIQCAGIMKVGLKFSGGTGPQTGTASILETNAKQQQRTCSYLNIQDDDACWIPFTKNFEIVASHPGNYTRFDVLNGGLFSVKPAALAALTVVETTCTPRITFDPDAPVGASVPQFCLGNAGDWMTSFSGIRIDVDAGEGMALLDGLVA